jgi:hypothetical protein
MGADGYHPQPAQTVRGIAGSSLRQATSATGLRFNYWWKRVPLRHALAGFNVQKDLKVTIWDSC